MDITLDQANRIIALALQRSAEAGYKPMAVVVLDASGHTRSAQRQDGASMFRIDIATGKAWASIDMGAASRVLTAVPGVGTLEGRNGHVADFAPDGTSFVAADVKAHTASLRDAATGKRLATLQGHSGQVLAVAYSPKGDVVATGAEDGTARHLPPRQVTRTGLRATSVKSSPFAR